MYVAYALSREAPDGYILAIMNETLFSSVKTRARHGKLTTTRRTSESKEDSEGLTAR
jgi:hypothetical protein